MPCYFSVFTHPPTNPVANSNIYLFILCLFLSSLHLSICLSLQWILPKLSFF